MSKMATRRSNNARLPPSLARGLPVSDSPLQPRNNALIGAEGGVELPADEWLDDDDYEMSETDKEANSLPAAAGDCGPTPNRRRPRAAVHPAAAELYQLHDDYHRPNLGRRTYSEQLDRRPPRRRVDATRTRLDESQSDKAVSGRTDKTAGHWTRSAHTDVDGRWNQRTPNDSRWRLHAAAAGGSQLAVGAGDSDPAGTDQYTGRYVTDAPTSLCRGRSPSRYDDDDGCTAAVESYRYHVDETGAEATESATTDVHHTRRRRPSTTAQSATERRRQRSDEAYWPFTEPLHDVVATAARDQSPPVERRHDDHDELDVASPTTELRRAHDDDTRRRGRSASRHDQPRDRPRDRVTDQLDHVPRRLVFQPRKPVTEQLDHAARRRRGSELRQNDDDYADDVVEDGEEEETARSVTRRVSAARNVRCLLQAVNRAAMRVSPHDPDAFLSLLSTTPGHAEQLHDDDQVAIDEALQTDDQWHVDSASAARISQLRREMVDLQAQQRTTELVTYVMAPVTAVLMLMFSSKLWTAVSGVVDLVN